MTQVFSLNNIYLFCDVYELSFSKTIEIHLKHASWLHMQLRYPKYAIEGCQMLNFSIDRRQWILS